MTARWAGTAFGIRGSYVRGLTRCTTPLKPRIPTNTFASQGSGMRRPYGPPGGRVRARGAGKRRRSEHQGAEHVGLAEADLVVGAAGGLVPLVDVQRHDRSHPGADLLDDGGHAGSRQALATTVRCHPDTLDLGVGGRGEGDLRLEHDSPLLVPREGPAVADQLADPGAVTLRA